MKLLIDAQLPRRLTAMLQAHGHDVLHTLDLPLGNRTPDRDITAISLDDQRIVVTKDADFVNSFLLLGVPYKLLLISTGNIPNSELLALFLTYLADLDHAFGTNRYVELSRTAIIIHA